MENIILHVYYEGTEEDIARFVSEVDASGVHAAVRAEKGCLQYDYFFPAEGEELLLLEKWQDAECLKAHSEGKPMEGILAVKKACRLTSRVEKYE